MKLMERYWGAIDDLFAKVRATQTEAIEKAADIVVDSIRKGGKIYLSDICHSIEMDSIYRGGGPIFYKKFDKEAGIESLKENDVIFVSSVSGRTKKVVDLAYDCMQKGIRVIAFTSMSYATQVEAVHESGKKLYEFVTLVLDNCAPAAEAMLEVEGIEARFGAASGMASNYIMWSITSCVVEKMLSLGMTPGILKSANFPGGSDYNKQIIVPNYEKYGF